MRDHVDVHRAGHRLHPADHHRQLAVAEGLRDMDVTAAGHSVGERGGRHDPDESERAQEHRHRSHEGTAGWGVRTTPDLARRSRVR
ncbi:hypothetical protein ACTMTF_20800 [Nonomuraea sp. ZG12]|uniref:hypothetical protein n=1 Tax=Nonomuraea sp. ZG12 TaxID=3452207 RepID=UPI003F8C58AA